MAAIQIKGLEELSDFDKKEANRILELAYEKFKRSIKNDFVLKVVIKTYEKAKENPGKRKKYSINATIMALPPFDASYADWDLNKALHRTMEKLAEEIEHTFHVMNQHKRTD